MSFLEDGIRSIGKQLATTAVEKLSESTGIDVGGTLSYLFGNGQSEGGQNLAQLSDAINEKFAGEKEQLTLLQADMFQQSQALTALGGQITAIAGTLSLITGEIQNIENMLKKIGQEQLYQNWQAVDSQMTIFLDAIDTAYSTYGSYISGYKTTPTVEVAQLIQEILDVNVGPKVGLATIHDFLMGNGQRRGALQLWSLMVTPLVQDGTLDYRLAVQQYFQYYQKLTYAQLQAANLVMEAYNYNGDPTNAKLAWDQYRLQILSQEDTFINWLVPLVYSGVQGGIFVPPGLKYLYTNFATVDAAMQLNPLVQYVRGDADAGDSYYQPSQIFADAEQLLATLYVTNATDRRIVVHMLYSDGGGIPTLLSNLQLQLSPVNSAETVGPVSRTRLGSPFAFPAQALSGAPYPDGNFFEGDGFYLNRYVFIDSVGGGGLTDGQFTMTDLNGQNGLLPIETYMSGTQPGQRMVPFQLNSLVNYVMEVNTADPFDFMNFLAYNVPQLFIDDYDIAWGATADRPAAAAVAASRS